MTYSTRIALFVRPLSRRTESISELDGTPIIKVPAPPEKEKANREIVRWIARKLGKPSCEIRIIAGLRSNRKIIEIYEVDKAELKGPRITSQDVSDLIGSI